MGTYKPIPIGHEDFKRVIEEGLYYVDKTLFVKDIIDNKGIVNLFTRPRRFGKTLNLSMLRYYFEKSEEDNTGLFEHLAISQAGEEYRSYMGQYPVISLSLKSMKQATYREAYALFKKLVAEEFARQSSLLDMEKLSETERKAYMSIVNMTADQTMYLYAIRFLSECLLKTHGKKTIILIDEYDVPLENAYLRGFYDEMVDFIRSVFESALKTNPALEFSVLTGCLRVSKESIFTGLNNPDIYSVINNKFSQYFGFTEREVCEMAEYYEMSDKIAEMKEWYDGYLFGDTEIYNPWSIVKYVKAVQSGERVALLPYWSNTSSNDIIRELIFNGETGIRNTIEELMNGQSVEMPLYEDITYRNIDVNADTIWSFLLFTGYLKPLNLYQKSDNLVYFEGVIPNVEVWTIYQTTIRQWFDECVKRDTDGAVLNAAMKGDAAEFETEINRWLRKCISYHDTYENFYHGFLTGLLAGAEGYTVKSNRENGDGRSDIVICEYQKRTLAVVIEIKVAKRFQELEKKCDEALKQIEEMHYAEELAEECYQNVIKYGVAFYHKSCMVKMD